MAISINSPSSYPSTQATRSSTSIGFERVSSGKRINSAMDDAAGLAIANRLSTQANGINVATRNAGDGISLTQTADGALASITSNLQRIRELALQSANGSLTDQDRQSLQAEAQHLGEANSDILENTNFNGVKILSDDSPMNFQIGPNAGDQLVVSGANLEDELASLGLNDINLGTQDGASAALSALDDAAAKITSRRSEFGSVASRITSTVDSLQTSYISASASRSRIEDADLAKEITDLTASKIRNQAQIAIQAQANSQRSYVLKLLQ